MTKGSKSTRTLINRFPIHQTTDPQTPLSNDDLWGCIISGEWGPGVDIQTDGQKSLKHSGNKQRRFELAAVSER